MKPTQIFAFILVFAVGSACASVLVVFPLLLLAALGGLVGWLVGVKIQQARRERLMQRVLDNPEAKAKREKALGSVKAFIMGRSPSPDSPNVISIRCKRLVRRGSLW